jgi:two-component system LytT family sensor kinase
VSAIVISVAVLGAVLSRYTPTRDKFLFAGLVAIALSVVLFQLTYPAFEYYGKGNEVYLEFLRRSAPIRIFIGIAITVIASAAFIFYSRIKELEDAQRQSAATSSMAREAELQKLQLQLQPHFLFNSLNSINALIFVQPPKGGRLSAFVFVN